MKQLIYPALLLCLTSVAACSDSATDQPLPAGTAPNQPADTPDADASAGAPPRPADQKAGQTPPIPPRTGRIAVAGMSCDPLRGWTGEPGSPPRMLTLRSPEAFPDAEIAVTYWPTGVGPLEANIRRWAINQLGMTDRQLADAHDAFVWVEIDGQKATWVPLTNPATGDATLAAWVPRSGTTVGAGETWIVKCSCTVEQAKELEPVLKQWVQTIRFE